MCLFYFPFDLRRQHGFGGIGLVLSRTVKKNVCHVIFSPLYTPFLHDVFLLAYSGGHCLDDDDAPCTIIYGTTEEG